jgi:tripartite-type tricarboxylate transporter receptor subunit TctC
VSPKVEKYFLKRKEENMKRSILIVGILFCMGLFGLTPITIQAQSYPERNIQLVIPTPPGSAVDIVGRLVGEELGKILGTQVIAMNKPGASMTSGTDAVVRSKKDGYTLLYATTTAMVYSRVPNPGIVPYDPVKDLEPLGMHLWVPAAIVVNQDSPWKTFSEYIEYAKKNPGKLSVSIHSVGAIEHFNLEVIKSLTDAQFNMIPFKGASEALTGLLGGHVDSSFVGLILTLPHVKSGKMRILLTTRKWPGLPELPTLTELGYKQELSAGWFAFYAPAGIPEEVKKILVSAFEKVAKNPEMKSKIDSMGFTVDYKSPAELKKIMIEDFEEAMGIAKKIGMGK